MAIVIMGTTFFSEKFGECSAGAFIVSAQGTAEAESSNEVEKELQT